jgi:hypothetical protein
VPTIQDETADGWWARREMRLLPTLRRQFQRASSAATASRSRRIFCARLIPNFSPSDQQRAQGMPGDDLTHGPPATKKQAALTTGSAGSTGIPCAMVLRLISRSPQGPGSFAPVISEKLASQELSVSVGTPGPRDFTVRKQTHSSGELPRPSHAASYVRDDRYTPLWWRRDDVDVASDLGLRSTATH